jgi:hypothetical protein
LRLFNSQKKNQKNHFKIYPNGMKIPATCTLLMLAGHSVQGGSSEFGPCGVQLLPESFSSRITIEGETPDAFRREFEVLWKHTPNTDSIRFYMEDSSHALLYVKDNINRQLFDLSSGSYRQIGLHHLREPIFQTDLRLEDFDLLIRSDLECRDSLLKEDSLVKMRSEHSQWWWSLYLVNFDFNPIDSIVMYSSLERRRISFSGYELFQGKYLPTHLDFSGNNPLLISNIQWDSLPVNHTDTSEDFSEEELFFDFPIDIDNMSPGLSASQKTD